MVQAPTLHLITHLHMPPCDFGGPPASPQLLEPPTAAAAPLLWGSGTVLEEARYAGSHLDEACLRDYYIMALRVFLDQVRVS